MAKMGFGVAVLAFLASCLAAASAYERKVECRGVWMEKPEGFFQNWTPEQGRDGRFISCYTRSR